MQDYRDLPIEKRIADCDKVLKKFPTKVPIICVKNTKSQLPSLEKEKFLIPKDLLVIEFQAIIRQKINLDKTQGLYFLIEGKLMPKNDSLMRDVYKKNKGEDGFLYIVYAEENITG
mmetsp:Transcript_19033/g.21354  ORF Transcript_19033/g.21354 Transcript_19033/m.21354 type:complete len:116 (+) Transcript_19033:43-390(+)